MVHIILDQVIVPRDNNLMAVFHVYSVDGNSEDTQGTIRDNKRAEEMIDIISSHWGCIKGKPPRELPLLFRITLSVFHSKRGVSSHTHPEYQAFHFGKEYFDTNSRAMQLYNKLEQTLDRGVRKMKKVKAEKELAKKARREQTQRELRELGVDPDAE